MPIWYSYEPGGEVVVLTDGESVKGRLLERAGRFSLCAQDETPPSYRYVSVEGPATIAPSDRTRRASIVICRIPIVLVSSRLTRGSIDAITAT